MSEQDRFLDGYPWKTQKKDCPDCAALRAENEALAGRVAELEAEAKDLRIDNEEYAAIEQARHTQRMDELDDAIEAVRNLPSVKERDTLAARVAELEAEVENVRASKTLHVNRLAAQLEQATEALRNTMNCPVCGKSNCASCKAELRVALAAIENEVTADGHVRDEAQREEEVMEGGGAK